MEKDLVLGDESDSIQRELVSVRGRGRVRRGFTAVEFLTTISIIFILLTLLLPAVQRMRAVAKATQCKNNLKQYALALHNYHDAHQTFPPGYISIMGIAGVEQRNEWAWQAFLLPYVEQGPMAKQMDFSNGMLYGKSSEFGGTLHVQNTTLAATEIITARCPEDEANPLLTRSLPNGRQTTYWATSYSGIMGIHWMDLPCATISRRLEQSDLELTESPCVAPEGVFYLNSRTRMKDIKDGASQTIFVGEASGLYDFPMGNPASRTVDGQDVLFFGGSQWAGVSDPIAQDEVLTATIDGINQAVTEKKLFSPGLSSSHDNYGGAHVALVDGSIRFLSNDIDSSTTVPYGVLQHLSTIRQSDQTAEF